MSIVRRAAAITVLAAAGIALAGPAAQAAIPGVSECRSCGGGSSANRTGAPAENAPEENNTAAIAAGGAASVALLGAGGLVLRSRRRSADAQE